MLGAVADEASAELGRQRHAMLPLKSSDIPDLGSGVGIHYLHGCAPREVNAPSGGIHGDVIEIFAGACGRGAERIGLEELVAAVGRTRYGQAGNEENDGHHSRQGHKEPHEASLRFIPGGRIVPTAGLRQR